MILKIVYWEFWDSREVIKQMPMMLKLTPYLQVLRPNLLWIYLGNFSEHPPCTAESEESFPLAVLTESQTSQGAPALPMEAQLVSPRCISQILGFVLYQEANECPQQLLCFAHWATSTGQGWALLCPSHWPWKEASQDLHWHLILSYMKLERIGSHSRESPSCSGLPHSFILQSNLEIGTCKPAESPAGGSEMGSINLFITTNLSFAAKAK